MHAITIVQGWCPWCGQHMGWGGWGMMIFWLIILIVVIAVAWTAMQRAGRGTGPGRDRAEEALRERYARGEIDEETYRRMLNELRRP